MVRAGQMAASLDTGFWGQTSVGLTLWWQLSESSAQSVGSAPPTQHTGPVGCVRHVRERASALLKHAEAVWQLNPSSPESHCSQACMLCG